MAQITWNDDRGWFECGDKVFRVDEFHFDPKFDIRHDHNNKMRHFQVTSKWSFDVDRFDHVEYEDFRCDFWAKDFEDAKRKAMKVIEMWME